MENKRKIGLAGILFAAGSLVSGVINGLLGAGGGVLMLYLVRWVLRRRGGDDGVQKDVFATVVAIILPVSAVSAVSYAASGNLDMDTVRVFFLPAVIGGALGAYLTDRLPVNAIRFVFALLVIVSGVRMAF